jgi:DNA-binding MarR family transcriptional regulator
MFEFLIRTGPERSAALARRGLTPNDSRALNSLDAEEGRTMRSLAEEWQCDASYATQVVDRLETLGLATRRSVAHDRRLKVVHLTSQGARLRAELMEEFHAPPAELLALTSAELEALARALERLPRGR